MDNQLKIPYEKSMGTQPLRAPVLEHFLDNRETQMRYTKAAVESNLYRDWITQLTKAELKEFIEINKERLQKGLESKALGPKLDMDHFWRIALYKLELLHREHKEKFDHDHYTKWHEEVLADRAYWEALHDEAHANWQAERGITPIEDASFMTPYY
jgi:hypothetical protein